MSSTFISELVASSALDLAPYEDLYKFFHNHPELSHMEENTSETLALELEKLGAFDIFTNIGGYGLAGVMKNGDGQIVLLRADFDALPVEEKTELPYASTKRMLDIDGIERPVMHACGHDMHITCLLAAAKILVKTKDSWKGTLVILFQPEEERGTGAQSMVDGGLYEKIPIPDYVLGQHVMALKAGTVGSKVGTIMAAADSYKIRVYGRGGHGSMPHTTIDPVMMAANICVRLQNIVSREVNANDMAVVTIGSIHAGQAENIIPDFAEIGIDVRSVEKETRNKIVSSIKRIVHAEYIASGASCEPTIVQTRFFPTTDNNKNMADKVARGFKQHFGDSFDADIPRTNVAEDVSILATSQGKPYLFWFFGCVDAALWDKKEKAGKLEEIPRNHSAYFAPTIQPTMQVGIDALCVAALSFLIR